jgi:hypothetical protein
MNSPATPLMPSLMPSLIPSLMPSLAGDAALAGDAVQRR